MQNFFVDWFQNTRPNFIRVLNKFLLWDFQLFTLCNSVFYSFNVLDMSNNFLENSYWKEIDGFESELLSPLYSWNRTSNIGDYWSNIGFESLIYMIVLSWDGLRTNSWRVYGLRNAELIWNWMEGHNGMRLSTVCCHSLQLMHKIVNPTTFC